MNVISNKTFYSHNILSRAKTFKAREFNKSNATIVNNKPFHLKINCTAILTTIS